jgi:dipeptidase
MNPRKGKPANLENGSRYLLGSEDTDMMRQLARWIGCVFSGWQRQGRRPWRWSCARQSRPRQSFGRLRRVAALDAATRTSVLWFILVIAVLTAAVPCQACFSIVVGKNASTDGCVIVGHNEDDTAPQIVNHHKVPRRHYPAGASVTLRNGGTLEQVEQTWAYIWSEMPGMSFSDSYVNPKAAFHPNNIGRQWSGLNCIARAQLTPGPGLPFSVVPKHKLSVLDAMQILRHDKESQSGPAPADSPFVCALCSGATQTSFVAQLRTGIPLDIGIVYWACLASPRTSFYLPFHFGISNFPAGFRLPSQRPASEVYNRRVDAPFAVDPQEAFWMFSNFRDQVDRCGPAITAAVRAEAQRIERDAVALQRPMEEVALRLYKSDQATALRLLENYSKGVYLSCMEVMDTVLSGR